MHQGVIILDFEYIMLLFYYKQTQLH